ncbi:MAG: class I SAM-dependent methyltransferase [Chloroflexi bacterium]|nr:class I SAM-dependent methyltransferase [Chloroflexota bacterium]
MKNTAYEEMFLVETSHWWYRGLHDLTLLLVEKLFVNRTLDIFDAGCGTGRLMYLLNQKGHDVAGLDYSDDALAFCAQRGLNHTTKGDLNDWVPSVDAYDLITCFDVLCHQWVRDDVAILKSLAGGLKEEGLLFLNDPAFPFLSRGHDRIVMIRERYTKKSFCQVLASANLQPVLMSYRLPHAFIILSLLRGYETLNKNMPHTTSDIANIPPRVINHILYLVTRLENRLVASGISLLFGSSLFTVARRGA